MQSLLGHAIMPASYLSSELVFVGDACQTLLGRHAARKRYILVNRGNCTFATKARHAEQAEAYGMIVINSDNSFISMTDDGSGRKYSVHCVLVRQSDGDLLKRILSAGPVLMSYGMGLTWRNYRLS
jgi:hypothetical protein